MVEISYCNVSKTYNPGLFQKKVHALCGMNLNIGRGEVFGLIGPNGAGKSTTIRLLLGLMRPSQGTILFRGQPLGEAGIQREIGYLPENPYLYDHLTLRELLEFGGRTSGMDARGLARRIDDLLDRVEMATAQKRPLRTFSKGMLQRAGICFALLHDPSVVILDEPMSGLDPMGRKLVFDIVMDLKAEGKTIFFCSHILSDVERLCDRIGVLVGGRLVREMLPAEFREDQTRPLHLVTEVLSFGQLERLQRLEVDVTEEGSGSLLSVAPQRLAEVLAQLHELGLQIRETRSERVSLESLFIQTVEDCQK